MIAFKAGDIVLAGELTVGSTITFDRNVIHHLNSDGVFLEEIELSPEGDPLASDYSDTDMVFDGKGNLYVATRAYVIKFDKNGNNLGSFIPNLNTTSNRGITTDAKGKYLYVHNQPGTNFEVRKYDLNATLIETYVIPGPTINGIASAPETLSISPDGTRMVFFTADNSNVLKMVLVTQVITAPFFTIPDLQTAFGPLTPDGKHIKELNDGTYIVSTLEWAAHFDAAGVLIREYPLSDYTTDIFNDQMFRFAVTKDQESFWAVVEDDTCETCNPPLPIGCRKIRISDGVELDSYKVGRPITQVISDEFFYSIAVNDKVGGGTSFGTVIGAT